MLLSLLFACTPEPTDGTDKARDTSGEPSTDTSSDSGADTAIDTSELPTIYWEDVDNDGFGNPARPVEAFDQPAGTANNDLDCNDLDAFIRPDAQEVCNEVDDDCDGQTDDADESLDLSTRLTWYLDADGDGHVGDTSSVDACRPPEGAGPLDTADDCDDADAAVNPSAPEVCGNDVDDNCDGGAAGCSLGAGTYADADALYEGERTGDFAGFALALGDVSGDAELDLLMGLPMADTAYTNSGEVAFFSMPATGIVPFTSAAGAGAVTATGFSEAELGSAVAFVGDVSGDGIGDFVAGAPGYNSFPGAWAVFEGGSSFPTEPWATGLGSGSDECGFAVAAGGDLDGDGSPDWVVGCPGRGWGEVEVWTSQNTSLVITASANGELGGSLAIDDFNGDGQSDLAVADLDDERVYWFAGPIVAGSEADLSDGDFVGGADDGGIAAVGDPSNDGYSDLMSGGAQEEEGRFYNGSSGNLLTTSIQTGEMANAMAGGDLDGDGVGDIVVGDQATNTVELYYGPVGSSFNRGDWLEISGNGNEAFGMSVAIGDVSHDGLDDLLVGASQNTSAGLNAGGVYLFEGISF